jgi:hypothetical protein
MRVTSRINEVRKMTITDPSRDEQIVEGAERTSGVAVLLRSGLLFIVIPILLMLALKYLLSI